MQYKIAPAVEEEQDKALLDLYDTDKKLVSYNYADSTPYTVTVAEKGYMAVPFNP